MRQVEAAAEALAPAAVVRKGEVEVHLMRITRRVARDRRVTDALLELQSVGRIETGRSTRAMAISCDGKMVATGYASGAIKVWNVPRGTLLKELTGHSDFVAGLAFSPTEALLASASHDGTVRLWDLKELIGE